VKAEAEAEAADAADPRTPHLPVEVLEGGKHSSEHASTRRWWRRWPVVAAALALAAVLALSAGLGVGLAGGGGGSPPAPLSTPCNGTSAGLVPGDCAAWQAFSNDPLYRAWVEGKCGGSARAHTDPCSCTFYSKTQCAGGRITYLNMFNRQLPGSAGVPVALLDLTGLTWLGLCCNALSGTIPTELALKLTGLTVLGLGSNALSGTIPPEMALKLAGLTFLALQSNPKLGGALPAFNFSRLAQKCCAMAGDPFTCPLPPGAQGCVGGPDCGTGPPPTCK
jgi:hypothetical protein